MSDNAAATAGPSRRPADNGIDGYGLTHQGLGRKNHQDHFLIAAVQA